MGRALAGVSCGNGALVRNGEWENEEQSGLMIRAFFISYNHEINLSVNSIVHEYITGIRIPKIKVR